MKHSSESSSTTDFGYETVTWQEKRERVDQVFHSVAKRYDLMNDLMSLGLHRLWKRWSILRLNIKPGHKVLDLAAGTGDLTKKIAKKIGTTGQVIAADLNASMLMEGRNKLIDEGYFNNIHFVQADAEELPFPTNYFHRISIAFGLRNIANKTNALHEMARVLKPGGKIMILEFSHPSLPLIKKIYDTYSFHWIPCLGKYINQDEESYRYLIESIRMHPTQQALCTLMKEANFISPFYQNLSGGIVAIHTGYKGI